MSVKFVECDSEKIISELVTSFENALGETLQPSDERRIFLNQLAQVIIGLKAEINDTGNQVLLRYSRGAALDAIGELFGVERLVAAYASCTLKFTLSQAQDDVIIIPKGTRATPNGNVYFATDRDLIIDAGSIEGEVNATATETGKAHNGFEEKQIKYIVDNVQFLKSVENTSVSAGGADEESDDSLRERIRLIPESFSTAGCSDGYVYYAKSASADVGDVVAYSPVNDTKLTDEEKEAGAGRVFVYFLKADGTIPDAESEEDKKLIEIVNNAVNAKDKRPLTDLVKVLPPTAETYSIDLDFYISAEDDMNATEIRSNVAKAIEEYVAWQGQKIGRDINPDKLRNLILNAGASRLDVRTPVYTTLKDTQVASLTGEITANFKGISE